MVLGLWCSAWGSSSEGTQTLAGTISVISSWQIFQRPVGPQFKISFKAACRRGGDQSFFPEVLQNRLKIMLIDFIIQKCDCRCSSAAKRSLGQYNLCRSFCAPAWITSGPRERRNTWLVGLLCLLLLTAVFMHRVARPSPCKKCCSRNKYFLMT